MACMMKQGILLSLAKVVSQIFMPLINHTEEGPTKLFLRKGAATEKCTFRLLIGDILKSKQPTLWDEIVWNNAMGYRWSCKLPGPMTGRASRETTSMLNCTWK